MSKKNIIVLNGKRYDAKTGTLLAGSEAMPQAPSVKTAKTAAKSEKSATRKPARHTSAHSPTPSRTLMRRAVKKPLPSHKKALKVQAHLDMAAARPLSGVLTKPSARRLDTTRLQHAKHISKSRLVSRFSSDLFSGNLANPPLRVATKAPAADRRPAQRTGTKPKTTAELLEYALLHANAHEQAAPKLTRRSLFKRRTRSAAT